MIEEEELRNNAEKNLKESFKYLTTLNLLNWGTFYYEGYRLEEENKIEEAIKSYKKALEVNPKADEALNNLSNLIKDDEEAAELYRKAIAINPNNHNAYYNLGLNLVDRFIFKEAEDCIRKALKIDREDDYKYYCVVAQAIQGQGRLDEALEIYQKALMINPEYYFTHYHLGTLYEHLEKFKEAEDCYYKVIELHPKDGDYYFYLAKLLEKQGKDKEAEEIFKKAIEYLPENTDMKIGEFHNLLAKCLDRLGKVQEAEKSFIKAIEENPEVSEFHMDLAKLLNKQLGRDKEAEESYRKAIENLPKNIDIKLLGDYYICLAKCLEKQGRLNDAEDYYKKAIETNPKNNEYYNNLANLLKSKEK